MLRLLMLAVIGLTAGRNAWARPAQSGTPQERLAYGDDPTKVNFQCPQGTKRTVQTHGQALEEFCANSEGVREGYYLRWSADGASWAVTGAFVHGRRNGTWRQWSDDRQSITTSLYKAGRLVKQQRYMVMPEVVAAR